MNKYEIYKIQLIIVISILMAVNLYQLVILGNLVALLPILVLSTVLTLFITKNRYASLALKVWGGVLLMSGGFGLLQIFSSLGLKALGEEPMVGGLSLTNIVTKVLFIVYGIYIFIGAKLVKNKHKEDVV